MDLIDENTKNILIGAYIVVSVLVMINVFIATLGNTVLR